MLKRLGIYLNEMFPITAFLGTVLTAIAVELVYLKLFGHKATFNFQILLPAFTLTFVSLLIRVMDEFKDYQDDLTNFPHRPLPSGRVKREDLQSLGFFCVMMIIFLSLTSMPLLLWSLVTLAFTGLMLKWFFIEDRMRKSLPLAFVSHHPIVFFNFTYLIIACMQMYPDVDFSKALLILPVCFMFTNWEIVRKIRAPEQETAYTTYSMIFGPRVAMSLSLAIQAIFNGTVLAIFHNLNTPMVVRWIYVILQLILIYPSLKFLFTLKLRNPLKPNAEGQILLVVGFLLIAAIL